MGEYVGKAKGMGEAEELIKKFWKKGAEKLPIIAQEFVKSPSYRVTVIGNRIEKKQTRMESYRSLCKEI